MFSMSTRLVAPLSLLCALTASAPRDTGAQAPARTFGTGKRLVAQCAPSTAPGSPYVTCNQVGLILSTSTPATHLGTVIDYDLFGPQFVFDAAQSGPLDVFAAGSPSVAAAPQTGTVPLPIVGALPVTPGTPLPGSTFSMVDNGLFVTVDYTTPTAVGTGGETNFLLLVFKFLHPITFDPATATVTYALSNAGGEDFTETAFSCLSGGAPCVSAVPTKTADISASVVPEPSARALLLGGCLTLVAASLRRRPGASRHRVPRAAQRRA